MRLRISVLLTLTLGFAACGRTEKSSEIKIVDDSLQNIDLLKSGSYRVVETEYTSEARVDTDVVRDVKTDIRGRLYMPQGKGPFPFLAFLHGNHLTCGRSLGAGNPREDSSGEFTLNGRCPTGFVEAPSYRGYDAAARHMASLGFAVISVNANRGLTGRNGSGSDQGLVYARGALVLRHLEEFYQWARDGQPSAITASPLPDLLGKIDFSNVGLMGHSRGGEGVRFAYNIYQDTTKWKTRIPGLQIKGIFEIAPVDFGTSAGTIEARGTAWALLLGGCDQDVYNFAGTKPFARMLAETTDGFPKSIFTLWGANHNFFNSEWQISDAPHQCVGDQVPLWDTTGRPLNSSSLALAGLTGSSAQINVEKGLMAAFFQSSLGDAPELIHVFDPQFRLPSQLANLAPSSREFVSGAGSQVVFDPSTARLPPASGGINALKINDYVEAQLDSLNESWSNYRPAFGFGGYSASVQSGVSMRPAVVLEGRGSEFILPLNSRVSAENFWTIDATLAIRKGCYSFDSELNPTCAPALISDDIEVALQLEDGSETAAVNLRDYVQLKNWFDSILLPIVPLPPSFGSRDVRYDLIPVLYQTTRFEFTDFGTLRSPVTGVILKFPSGSDVSLFVESIRVSPRG